MRANYRRASKYGSRKINTAEGSFDSIKEYKRWMDLRGLELSGDITELNRQVKFELIPHQKLNGKVIERACYYIADFVYKDKDNNLIVEDAKGYRTKEYIIKRKLMLSVFGIVIKEV